MSDILTNLTTLAGGELQLIALAGLFAGMVLVTLGAFVTFGGDEV